MRLHSGRGAYAMRYSDQDGWILEVDEAIPASALRSAARYAAKINADRVWSMPHGPMRERAGAAVRELEMFALGLGGRVSQRVTKPDGHQVELFKSTARTRPDRAIVDLGVRNG